MVTTWSLRITRMVLCRHIFGPNFAGFMKIVQEGDRYFDVSEKMMQVIESVDPLYDYLLKEKLPIHLHKPELIRRLLDSLEGKYDGYLSMSLEKRLARVLGLYVESMKSVNKVEV